MKGKEWLARLRRGPVLLACLTFIALAAVSAAVWWIWGNPNHAENAAEPSDSLAAAPESTELAAHHFALEPEIRKGQSIAVSSGFILRVTDGPAVTADEVAAAIATTPPLDLTVTQTDDGLFLLKPQQLLARNTVYTLAVRSQNNPSEKNYSWAFQTETAFSVVQSMPADGARGVLPDTGIEIQFSAFFTDGEPYFSIEPPVEGRFETHGKTLVFIPLTPLSLFSVYTVTMAGDFQDHDGNKLESSYSFSFRTTEHDDNAMVYYPADAFSESVLPGDPVVMELYATQSLSDTPFITSLYRLESHEQYWALMEENERRIAPLVGDTSDYTADVTALSKLSDFTASPESDNTGYTDRYFIVLPETPPEGFYLLDTFPAGQPEGKHIQKLIQISPLSVYCESVGGEAVVWVNDAGTGDASANAYVQVTAGGKEVSARTNTQGIARVKNLPQTDKASRLLIKGASGSLFAARLMLTNAWQPTPAQSFRSVFYLDRAAYLPNDTVRYWGILLPRYQGTALPSHLTLTMGAEAYPGFEAEVSVGADGSFQGEMKLSAQRSGYAPLSLKVGEETLVYSYLNVSEYTKPSYVLEAATDRVYYEPGQPVVLSVRGSFFDGTPAVGLSVGVSANGTQDASLTLDVNGMASVTLQPPSSVHHDPYNFYITARVTGAEDVSVWTTVSPYVFPSSVSVRLESAGTDSHPRFTLKARRFDFSKADAYFAGDQAESLYDALLGEPADVPGEYQITARHYRKVPVGSHYDFINKKNVQEYTYDEELTAYPAVPFVTQSGSFDSGALSYALPDGDPVQYEAAVYFTGPEGKRFHFTQMLIGRYPYYDSHPPSYYVTQTEVDGKPSEGYARLKTGQTAYFRIKDQADQMVTGRQLYTVFKDSYLAVSASDTGTSVVFSPEMAAVSFVGGAYFDGRHVYAARYRTVSYETEEKSLILSVTPSQQNYKPGAQAQLTVSLSAQDGTPVSAPFVLSVADEAAFAVQEQYTNPLPELYDENIWPQNFMTYASYVNHDPRNFWGGAEGGGEGGGAYLRNNFQDTAAFLTGRTDLEGTASLTFTLPDNLTSWRITAIAVSDDARVGFSKSNLIVSIPAFTQLVLNDKYTQGDTVTFSARMFGASVDPGDTVDYAVNLEGKQPYKEKLTAKAGDFTLFSLGELPKGEYTLTVTASTDRHSDAVKQTFLVTDSLLEVPVSGNMPLSELGQIDASRFPVTVSVFDKANERYFAILGKLLSSYGARTETVLGQMLAADLYRSFYTEHDAPVSGAGLASQYSGGLAINSYAEASAVLSAKALVTCPAYINQADIRRFLYDTLGARGAPSADVCAAYMGLAALREPVLGDIQYLLAHEPSLSLRDSLYLAAGLALLGDLNGAEAWYDRQLKPLFRSVGTTLAVQADDPGESYALTAEAAFLSLLLAHKNAGELYDYLLANHSGEYLPALELCGYITYMSSPKDTGGRFRFVRNGQTVTEDLTGKRCVSFTLSQEQLKNADFQILSGDLMANVSYTGGFDCLPMLDNAAITVQKSITMADGTGLGALAKVTLDVTLRLPEARNDLLYDGLTLTDVLPGNLRFASCPYRYDEHWYLDNREKQTLTFQLQHIYPYYSEAADGLVPQSCNRFTIVYYARLVLPGTYVSESAVVTQDGTGLSGASERGVWGTP